MRLIHIADVHLGANPEGKDGTRGKEIWETFRKVLQEVDRLEVDLLLIAGDLFHRQPLLRELKELNYLFGSLKKAHVAIIAGNHDYISERSKYKDFVWGERVHFLIGRVMERVYIPSLEVYIHGFSYYGQELLEPLYDMEKPSEEPGLHILLAHGGDARHIPIQIKKLARAGFDYVALGHIHQPMILQGEALAYSGSLEPLDHTEVGKRGFILGELKGDSGRFVLKPFSQRSFLRWDIQVHNEMTYMELRAAIKNELEEKGQDNMHHIVLKGLRDPEVEFDLEELTSIGNVVSVQDETTPDYNFQHLMIQHKSDLLGGFLQEYLSKDEMTAAEKKALFYGTRALLEAMDRG